jgi:hypothetical protein
MLLLPKKHLKMSGKVKVVLSVFMIICFIPSLKAHRRNDSLFIPQKHIIKTRILYPLADLFLTKEESTKMLGFAYENVLTKKRTIHIFLDFTILYAVSNGFTGYSKSTGVSLFPEYRFYPFNKKKVYPRGLSIGPSLAFGAFTGWNEIYKSNPTYNGTLFVPNYSLIAHSNFKAVTIGAGAVLGWQYFLGKRKRFTMSNSFGFYMNKNIILYESSPISDVYRMYPENELSYSYNILFLLGYSFN